MPFVTLADTKPRVGDWVIAIGNPFGLGSTVTAGIVSAMDRDIASSPDGNGFIQIDAPINRGNSGGPTFDMRVQVIGMGTDDVLRHRAVRSKSPLTFLLRL